MFIHRIQRAEDLRASRPGMSATGKLPSDRLDIDVALAAKTSADRAVGEMVVYGEFVGIGPQHLLGHVYQLRCGAGVDIVEKVFIDSGRLDSNKRPPAPKDPALEQFKFYRIASIAPFPP